MDVKLVLGLLLGMALAGCAGGTVHPGDVDADPPAADGAEPADGASSQTLGGVRLLEHADGYYLNHPMEGVTMHVPANVTTLHAQLTTTASGPCGAVAGEPEDVQHPRVVFTAPSGAGFELDANARQCRVGVLADPPVTAVGDAAAEAGDWQVSFYGRSLGMSVRLVVDGT